MSRNIATKNNFQTSDRLHNENCYHYLKNLKIMPAVLRHAPEEIRGILREICLLSESEFKPTTRYADLYKDFFIQLEENINDFPNNESFKALIYSLYHNDNGILEKTFEVIKAIPLNHVPSANHIEKTITHHISDKGKKVNKSAQSPVEVGSIIGRLVSILASDFKPQHTTGLATIRHYDYHDTDNQIIEYRFSTQGQRHDGKARVSPLFEYWLNIQALNNSNSNRITHIYFNNLGRDRSDSEGRKEKALTAVLEQLEKRHNNIAVITLPADKGLFAQDDYKELASIIKRDDIEEEFFTIAKTNHSNKATDVCDFYISNAIRAILFVSEDDETHQLRILLNNSFDSMGMTGRDTLSQSEKQAVWFHFIKFELTNYIINKLEPKSINFSCKDAIDRGGVSSLYYNLIKSFLPDSPCPLSRDEFDKGLHAAPAMVKGRGMNHHLNLIWNAVDVYINANYDELHGSDKAWLIEWRDLNCPHERVNGLLLNRLEQCRNELKEARRLSPDTVSINTGLLILNIIEQQIEHGVSGKRLLLEAITRTPEIALNPNSANKERYGQLADELTIKNPLCKELWGLMKVLAGIIIFSKRLIDSGWATKKSGQYAKDMDAISFNMKVLEAIDEEADSYHP